MTSVSREQRAYTRKQLTLDVEVSSGGMVATYEVRDYCSGGMLLIYKQGPQALQPAALAAGSQLTINFSLPIRNGIQHLELDARVARTFDLGIGVAFINPSPATLQALQEPAGSTAPVAESQPDSPGLTAANKHQILSRCRQILSKHLFDMLHDFFSRADDRLLECAQQASNNQEQSAYFEVIAELSRFRQPITEAFHDAVLERVDKLDQPQSFVLEQTHATEEMSSFELSIVDHDEFERWILVSAMISKIESHFSEELFDLLQRLMELTDVQGVNKENNPLGPAVICRSFCDALKVLHLQLAHSSALCSVFEQIITPYLARLYHDLSHLFVKAGILPVIQRKPQILEAPTAMPQQGPSAQGEHSVATAKSANTAERAAGHGSDDAYQVALELLNLQKHKAGHPTTDDEQPALYYSADELFEAINSLPHDEGLDLKSELTAALKQRQGEKVEKQIAREQGDTIELTDNLLSSILEDALLTEITKAHIDKLRVPLLKTALQDSSFFTTPSHPARLFLNLVAQLGTTSGRKGEATDINPELLRTINQLAVRIDRQLGQSDEIFAEAAESLTPLVRRQDESFARNVDRAIKACEGARKIRLAREATRDSISSRIVGKRLPASFLTLLSLGWPNVLVITYLRNGPDSDEWLRGCHVLDDMLLLLGIGTNDETGPTTDLPQLLHTIKEGLGYISFDVKKINELIGDLQPLLSGQTPASERATLLIDQEAVDSRLGYTLNKEFDVRRYGVDADISTRPEEEQLKWLGRAKALQCGDWVVMASASTGRQLLKLVWMEDDRSFYCFVNRKGIKTLELSLKELAGLMLQHTIEIFQDAELPLVERGVHRMLQEMHEKLVLHATRDPLTGLLNRKEFYKRLERALESARQTHVTHVLCHIDLDQFNVINKNCGHLAGDELLKQAARLFSEHIDESGDIVRLGNDEFGLLITNCSEADGYKTADELRGAMETFRFVWEENHYPVTICIGLTLISEESESVGDLLKSADSACYAAKDAGFNRIQVYQPDDAKLVQHHEVISWVARIDSILDEDNLTLYCQLIEPLAQDATAKPHYEILLRVTDEQGKTVAPASFINAAELSNRMPDVDRWIIRKVFAWMAENRDKLADFGGFSINLSGCSLNDEGFLEYILQQFAESNIPAEKVCFEVTETAAISSLSNAADFISQLKQTGCTFALDDFGSGLSSYSYLKHLPVDFLKIDGMFIKDIASNEADYAMVKSINELSHFLGKRTIAEYVENETIRDHLITIGVDFAQGYGIERPRCLQEICR